MSASITLAGESQIALKQSQKKPLIVSKFIFANIPQLNPETPVDRAAGKPQAGQIVHVYDIPPENAGFVNPNQVVYSAQLGADIGDWDFNWVGLEDADGLLFAVSYVPLQQKRRNIPPEQIGNNVTRNFLVAYDGAMQLTGIKIDASTWQHDFTVRLAGIDERERLSNREVYGRACFFGNSLAFGKSENGFQLGAGIAYIEGIRVFMDKPWPFTGVIPAGTITLDVCLERQLSDRVATWKVVYGEQADYTDAAGVRHYCVPIAFYTSTTEFWDARQQEPIAGPLVQHFAAREGDYANLRARGTTKEDVDLGNLPNAISDDPATNSSEILATTAALNRLHQQVGDSMTGMVAAFSMSWPPEGWLKCNGAAVSRTTYARLFALLGVHYGAGDGSTTFNLPEMRGMFARGFDDGRGVDIGRDFGSSQAMSIQSHVHAASSGYVADHVHGAWTDAQGNHNHSAWTDAQGTHDHGFRIVDTGAGINVGYPAGGSVFTELEIPGGKNADGRPMRTDYQGNHAHNVGIGAAGQHAHNVGIGGAGGHSHGISVFAAGGAETRPRNVALLFCIKY
ncbi:phage tail protein [Pseudomonas sp. A34-9]|uniref:phage tail-collar fiber domain-containing protein n=1 Tax=Pseudomonas sp. A34-9 TaxID=3034675 RepID=UPI00240D6E3D|nr:phage tail protein [Pseudomonas sp. A34-9]